MVKYLGFEPAYNKTYKMVHVCVPSKDSDQPGYSPSLIRAFPSPEDSLDTKLPIDRTGKTLIRLVDAQADLSLR